MNRFASSLLLAVLLAATSSLHSLAAEVAAPVSYASWPKGPPSDPGFFPLAVWLQNPKNAGRYRDAGINTYVGLWRGPTEEQLSALRAAGMKLICSQNSVALRHIDDPTIIGWMHGDEPDNAQSLGQGKGYGPPIAPERIVEHYQELKTKDPSRPVLLNLGQGVAWDNYIGRGVRRNHPEDYPRYIKGSDIASFDIYPAVHDHPDVAGNLWFVAYGVERLGEWSDGKKIVWNCLEASRISNPERKPSPGEVRAEAWMALIHGSRGLIYFVHQFKPVFREASLLDDPELLAGVTKLNREITRLAPALNTPTLTNSVHITSSHPATPVAHMMKRHQNALYLFTVAMRPHATIATFRSDSFPRATSVEVLGEDRLLELSNSQFTDNFTPWGVHLYRVAAP